MKNKILVLEDDPCLKVALTSLLRAIDPGVEVHWHVSSERATAEVADGASSYQLILADISTPDKGSGLDFWEVCRRKLPRVPFMFISGMPFDQFLRYLGPQTVCPPFLAKPFSLGECKQMVEGLLGYTPESAPRH